MMQTELRRIFDPKLLPDPSEFYASKLNKLIIGLYPIASACCPFHDDKKACLSLNLESGSFCCHSCGEHGENMLDFFMLETGRPCAAAVTELGAWVYED